MGRATRAAAFKDGNKGKRPARCTNQHLEYLDELRESGVTNMFGAQPYLMEEFDELSDEQADAILVYWMKTFGNADR